MTETHNVGRGLDKPRHFPVGKKLKLAGLASEDKLVLAPQQREDRILR